MPSSVRCAIGADSTNAARSRRGCLDYGAIATALGVKPGTVAATLHAAHAALRRQLLEVDDDRDSHRRAAR